MKVCMLALHSNPLAEIGTRDAGGMSVYLREATAELDQLGVCSDIFTLTSIGGRVKITNIGGNTRVIEIPTRKGYYVSKENLITYLPHAVEAIETYIHRNELSYSLIHSHYWLSAVAGELLSYRQDIPHVITFHTLGAVKNRASQNRDEPEIRLEKEKELTAGCNGIVALTSSEKEDLIELHPSAAAKIEVSGCGVNRERFSLYDKSDTRKKLGLPGNNPLLLFVGRFVAIKGIEVVFEALSLLRDENVTLLMVGGDAQKGASVYQKNHGVLDHSIEKKIDFLGRIPQVQLPLYYTSADAVIIPSLHESFCLVCLEALSCGTPVIGNSVGVMPEVLEKGNGILLKKNTPFELAESVKRLLIDKKEPIMERCQIRKTTETYSWKKSAEELFSFYQNLIKKDTEEAV